MDKKSRMIFLIGFMGTGKSAVAQKFAEMHDWKCRELDTLIEQKENRTISGMFAQDGEEYFRTVETEVLKESLEGSRIILSCGGGTPIKEENVEIMKNNGIVIWLKAEPATILDRVKDDNKRPLLQGNMNLEYIEAMINKRIKYYENAADFQIDTDQYSIAEICAQIKKILLKTEDEYV